MTEISSAAIAPRQPAINPRDLTHPLFPIYRRLRSSMSCALVEAPSFGDWLFQYNQNLVNEKAAKHPKYEEFLDWMRVNKGGVRKCPVGCFPNNFYYWIEGGRW